MKSPNDEVIAIVDFDAFNYWYNQHGYQEWILTTRHKAEIYQRLVEDLDANGVEEVYTIFAYRGEYIRIEDGRLEICIIDDPEKVAAFKLLHGKRMGNIKGSFEIIIDAHNENM